MDLAKVSVVSKAALIGAGIGGVVLVLRDSGMQLEDGDKRNVLISLIGMAGTAILFKYACKEYKWEICQ